MAWFPKVHPLHWPGDDRPPAGPRPRLDLAVMAAMLADLVLFAVYVAPPLRALTARQVRFPSLLAMLGLVWLGPFLGLLLRRGRGAALLSYGIAKLAVAAALVAWWWGNRLADNPFPLTRFAPAIAWHAFGVALAFAAVRGTITPAGTLTRGATEDPT